MSGCWDAFSLCPFYNLFCDHGDDTEEASKTWRDRHDLDASFLSPLWLCSYFLPKKRLWIFDKFAIKRSEFGCWKEAKCSIAHAPETHSYTPGCCQVVESVILLVVESKHPLLHHSLMRLKCAYNPENKIFVFW